MKRYRMLGLIAAVLVAVPGCGGDSPHSLSKQSIAELNELAAASEKKESPEKIKGLAEKLKATNDKMQAMKLSDDEKKKLMEKYKKEYSDAMQKLLEATKANPEGAMIMASVGGDAGGKAQPGPGSKPPEGAGDKTSGGAGAKK